MSEGWFERQVRLAEEEVRNWPEWMKQVERVNCGPEGITPQRGNDEDN